jgi:hypothetical protein
VANFRSIALLQPPPRFCTILAAIRPLQILQIVGPVELEL